MGCFIIDNILSVEDYQYLDDIGSHTEYKIKYIKEYVRKWLNVAVNKANKIEFIDAMCNAGIYKNLEFSTSLEVIQIFNLYALKYKNIEFCIYLNDNNAKRIEIYEKIIQKNNYKKCRNVKIYFDNLDVVNYLNKKKGEYSGYNNAMTLLYVDPYNFGIPNLISTITSFVSNVYCELIYNFFSSDIDRNANNSFSKSHKQNIISEIKGFIEYYDPSQMNYLYVLKELQDSIKKTSNIKYSFAYQFRTNKNLPLYYIVYFTPNIRGIELLKDTIWDVFEGDDNYYYKTRKIDHQQQNLFGNTIKDENIFRHAEKAIKQLIEKNKYDDFSFEYLKTIVLEKTILKDGQIINYIIKPLIKNNKILKNNLVSSRNYKDDTYKWCEQYE